MSCIRMQMNTATPNTTAKKHGEVFPDDGTFLYQFESEGESNVHDYFMSDRYVI